MYRVGIMEVSSIYGMALRPLGKRSKKNSPNSRDISLLFKLLAKNLLPGIFYFGFCCGWNDNWVHANFVMRKKTPRKR